MTKEEVEFLTTPERKLTRKKILTAGAVGIAAVATLLLINDQVQKLRGGGSDSNDTDV